MRITEKKLATLPAASSHASSCPGGGACGCSLQSYYWDSELVGFGVVVGRTGIKTFVARANVGGKKRRVKIGVAGAVRPDGHVWTVALARIEARQLLARMATGEDPNAGKRATSTPVAKPNTGPTLREGLELHIADMQTGRNRRRRVCSSRTIHMFRTEVPRHLSAWLDRPLAELTAAELQKVCDHIERETVPRAGAVNPPGRVQASKVISAVSAIWNTLDRRYELTFRNPAKRVSPGALEPRTVRINEGTFADWYAKVTAADMNPVRRDLQIVSLFTGVRSEGIRNVRWTDIDEERRLLHIRIAKGDKPYTIPLVETVREIFERRRADNAVRFAPWGGDDGLAFPGLTRSKPFRVKPLPDPKERRRVVRPGKDEPVLVQHLPGIHANRRTFNSVAMEIGVPTEARLALMNHEGKGVNTKHYAAVQTWDLVRAAAERIEAALRERLGMLPVAPAAPTEPAAPAALPSNVVPLLRAAS